jgi:hypothetical protein
MQGQTVKSEIFVFSPRENHHDDAFMMEHGGIADGQLTQVVFHH